MNPLTYIILKSESIEQLAKEVRFQMEKGYVPSGGVGVATVLTPESAKYSGIGHYHEFYQALVLKEEHSIY